MNATGGNRPRLDAPSVEEHKFATLGRVLAGVVHEINTPIGSILSNNEVILRCLDMLKRDLSENTPKSLQHAREIVDTCRSLAQVDKIACERISTVVRGLKGFARAGDSEFRKVDLAEQIGNTLKLLHGEFRRRIIFEMHFDELPAIDCNPGKLNQVLLNLIVNAGQAIEGEGKITIGARREGELVHVTIRDTGKGIPPEMRERVFHSGFTTKPAGEGAGLGLTISRQIVEDIHGGTLDFDSEPGEGTTFHIRIPMEHKKRDQ